MFAIYNYKLQMINWGWGGGRSLTPLQRDLKGEGDVGVRFLLGNGDGEVRFFDKAVELGEEFSGVSKGPL